jgi:hypothetical protein
MLKLRRAAVSNRRSAETMRAEEVVPDDIVMIPGEGGYSQRPLRIEAVRREQIVGGRPMMKFTLRLVPPAARPIVVERPVGSRVQRLLGTDE